jgi:hypothetical protein
LKIGEKYNISIKHDSTSPDYSGTPLPDYDYSAFVENYSYSLNDNDYGEDWEQRQFVFLLQDEDGLLGAHLYDTGDEFYAQGKTAELYLITPLLAPEAGKVVAEDSSEYYPVFYNDDDDNANDIIDSDESSVSGENDLLKVKLDILPDEVDFGKVSLSCTGTGIRIWTSADKNELLLDNQSATNKITWDLSEESLPDEIFVESIDMSLNSSASVSDISQIKLSYCDGSSEVDNLRATDTIELGRFRLSAFDLDIDSNNDNGTDMPECNREEDVLETLMPKYIEKQSISMDQLLVPLVINASYYYQPNASVIFDYDTEKATVWAKKFNRTATDLVAPEIEYEASQFAGNSTLFIDGTNEMTDNERLEITATLRLYRENGTYEEYSDIVLVEIAPRRKVIALLNGQDMMGLTGENSLENALTDPDTNEVYTWIDNGINKVKFFDEDADWAPFFLGGGCADWIRDEAIKINKDETWNKIIIIGHSNGGDAARKIAARQLGNFPIDLLVLLDPVPKPWKFDNPSSPSTEKLKISDNVITVLNYYQRVDPRKIGSDFFSLFGLLHLDIGVYLQGWLIDRDGANLCWNYPYDVIPHKPDGIDRYYYPHTHIIYDQKINIMIEIEDIE